MILDSGLLYWTILYIALYTFFIRQKWQNSMKRKWKNNYEKETQKTHNNSNTSHELKRAQNL